MSKVCRNPKCPKYGQIEEIPDARFCGECGKKLHEVEIAPSLDNRFEDFPRQRLKEIVAEYGAKVVDDPRRCEGLIRDLCGDRRREINLIISALKEGIPESILSSRNSISDDILVARLTKKLIDNFALSVDAARWAVESWVLALSDISVDENKGAVDETRGVRDRISESQNENEWIKEWEKHSAYQKLDEIKSKPRDESKKREEKVRKKGAGTAPPKKFFSKLDVVFMIISFILGFISSIGVIVLHIDFFFVLFLLLFILYTIIVANPKKGAFIGVLLFALFSLPYIVFNFSFNSLLYFFAYSCIFFFTGFSLSGISFQIKKAKRKAKGKL